MWKNAATKVIILCFSLGSLQLQAQEESETKFRFGIHGSPSISYIANESADAESSAKLKFGFGLMAEYHFADNYALSSGINVVYRGAELLMNDTSVNYQSQFLQLPVVLKMKSRQFGYFTYFAEFGGSLNFEIGEEVQFDPDLAPEQVQDSYVPPLNATFTIGAGVEYDLGGATSLIGGIYYNRSLIDNINDNHLVIDDEDNFRFDYVSLKIGVLF